MHYSLQTFGKKTDSHHVAKVAGPQVKDYGIQKTQKDIEGMDLHLNSGVTGGIRLSTREKNIVKSGLVRIKIALQPTRENNDKATHMQVF